MMFGQKWYDWILCCASCAGSLFAAWILLPEWVVEDCGDIEWRVTATMTTWAWRFIPLVLCIWLSGFSFGVAVFWVQVWLHHRNSKYGEGKQDQSFGASATGNGARITS